MRLLYSLIAILYSSLGCVVADAESKRYDNFPRLCEAALTAEAGDVLILKDGLYTIREAVTFRSNNCGTKGAPIIVRAETQGGVILRGNNIAFAFKPGSSHIVVSGFSFQVTDETAVKIEGANHIRVTHCDFELEETDSFDWLVISGSNSHHHRVDHCQFANKIEAGNFITIDGDASGQQSQQDRIDHNSFLNTAPRLKNEKEAIRIGQSRLSLSNGLTLIEHNYFEKCDGDPEIISLKSCKNIVRNNKIVDSKGVISLRHGNGSVVHSNSIIGKGRDACGGIRVYGDDHRIYNNYLANLTGNKFSAALAITNGNADDAMPGGNLTKHYRPRRIQVVNNTFVNNAHSIEIGYARSGKNKWTKAPQAIRLVNNLIVGNHATAIKTEALINILTTPTNWSFKNNLLWPKKLAELALTDQQQKENFVIDPRLSSDDDFLRPGKNSPAIDAGIFCEFVIQDLAGATRSSRPDLGALESTVRPLP